MNTLAVEEALASRYKYKPLQNDLSKQYRQFYLKNIPAWLNIKGSSDTLYTSRGSVICSGYERIVVGDYGAFVEFSKGANNIVIKPGQEYRINDERYSKNVKYLWLTIDDKSDVKIYYQKRTVAYADYVPGKYYVSVHEVYKKGGWNQCDTPK